MVIIDQLNFIYLLGINAPPPPPTHLISASSAEGFGGLLCVCLAEHISGLGLGHSQQTAQVCPVTYPSPASRAPLKFSLLVVAAVSLCSCHAVTGIRGSRGLWPLKLFFF